MKNTIPLRSSDMEMIGQKRFTPGQIRPLMEAFSVYPDTEGLHRTKVLGAYFNRIVTWAFKWDIFKSGYYAMIRNLEIAARLAESNIKMVGRPYSDSNVVIETDSEGNRFLIVAGKVRGHIDSRFNRRK